MQHQLAVGVLHRAQHLLEQRQALRNVELQAVSVGQQGVAGHILHHQERCAGIGEPDVIQPGNVAVFQRGQDVALAQQAGGQLVLPRACMGHLQGDLPVELRVGALGQPHRAHATLAHFAQQAPGPDQRSGPKPGPVPRSDGGQRTQEVAGLDGASLFEQAEQCRQQRRREIQGLQPAIPLRGRLIQRLLNQVEQAGPVGTGNGHGALF